MQHCVSNAGGKLPAISPLRKMRGDCVEHDHDHILTVGRRLVHGAYSLSTYFLSEDVDNASVHRFNLHNVVMDIEGTVHQVQRKF